MGISLAHFYRRESRRSLAIFDRKEIAHLGISRIAQLCWGAVEIAAAIAENRGLFSISLEILNLRLVA